MSLEINNKYNNIIISDGEMENNYFPKPKNRRFSYSIETKRRIIILVKNFMEKGGKYPQNKVADMENIDKTLISKWIKNKAVIMDMDISARTRKIHGGRPLKYEAVENELLEWIAQKRSLAIPISSKN